MSSVSSDISENVNGFVPSDQWPTSTEEHDKLELILENTVAQWSRPPHVLKILLEDLFAATPEDPLSWIHAEVWRIAREYSSSHPWTHPLAVNTSATAAYSEQELQTHFDDSTGAHPEKEREAETNSADSGLYDAISNDTESCASGNKIDTVIDIDFIEPEQASEGSSRQKQTPRIEFGPRSTPTRCDNESEEFTPALSGQSVEKEQSLGLGETYMPWMDNFKMFGSWIQKTGTMVSSNRGTRASRASRKSTELVITSLSDGSARDGSARDGFGCFSEAFDRSARDGRTQTRFIWNTAFLAFLLYEIWAVLFELVALPSDINAAWFQTATVATLSIFILDMAFSIALDAHGNSCETYCGCRLRGYMHFLFWIDIVSAASHFACIFTENVDWMRVMLCFRIPRILHLSRMRQWSMFLKARSSFASYALFQFVAGYHLVVLLVSHFDAILWMALQPDDASATRDEYGEYLNSFSLICAALTWGSDPATRVAELEAYGLLISAQRLSLFVLAFVWLSQQTAKTLSDMDVILSTSETEAYFRSRQVSSKVQARFMEKLLEINKVSKRQQHLYRFFTAEVPLDLRLKVSAELWHEHLSKFSLLHTLSEWHDNFILELAAQVMEDIHASGHVLVTVGDACKNAYLVLSGAFALSQMDKAPLPDYLPGMWIGEMALVNPELLHDATLTSKGITEVMVIQSECFWQVIRRLDLQKNYHTFLRNTVWTGVCGRCGTLGHHFSSSCPTVMQNQDGALARTFTNIASSWSLGARTSQEFQPMDSFQADQLLKFLQDMGLERLTPTLEQHGVLSINDLTLDIAQGIMSDPANSMSQREKKRFSEAVKRLWEVIEKTTNRILAHSGSSDNHLVFISHFKKEAGTEATLMAQELERIIRNSPSIPGHNLKHPCFVDSDNLTNLEALEEHVQNSHQLVLLLTPKVLTRPWVLVEIITAFTSGIPIIPVEIQRSDMIFRYPEEAYFERVRQGVEIDQDAAALLMEKGHDMEQMEKALRHVFNQIASPFSPHKATGIRIAEIKDLLRRCTIRGGRRSIGMRSSVASTLTNYSTRGSAGSGKSGSTARSSTLMSRMGSVLDRSLKKPPGTHARSSTASIL